MKIDDRTKEKINKLMRLAESDNEHEAANALNKALVLMKKYQVTHSDLEGRTVETITFNHFKVKISTSAATLYNLVGSALGCFVVRRPSRHTRQGLTNGQVILTGTQADIEITRYFYDMLFNQIAKKVKQYKRENQITQRQANDYEMGLVLGVSRRVEAQNRKAEVEVGTGLIPLDTRSQKAKDFYLSDHEIQKDSRKHRNTNHTARGHQDSKSISINRGVSGSGQQAQLGHRG